MHAYNVEGLSERHATTQFNCGESSLNAWLQNAALRAQRSGVSRTHVWTEQGDARVLAYFALAPQIFQAADLSKSQRSGDTRELPGYLLGKLALDQRLRKQNPPLGPELVLAALEKILAAADAVGGRLIAVDTVNNRVLRFYEEQGFQRLGNSSRLIMKMATARDVLK